MTKRGDGRLVRRHVASMLALFAAIFASAAPARAAAPSRDTHDAGAWDLSFEKGNRRCRVFLRTEASGDGYALAMPAGCRKAFPVLAEATVWMAGNGEQIAFKTAGGAPVLEFGPNGSPSLSAQAGQGDTYELMPVSPALQDAVRVALSTPALPSSAAPAAAPADGVLVPSGAAKGKVAAKAKPEAPAAPILPQATVANTAGNYAVLRQDRDTGCMVTLEPEGGRTGLRARLAPACRDQGIVIFDPAGWQLFHGNELVLMAKRGHTTALMRRDDKTWANAPPRGAPLVLKRL